jgi:hypothetical protein
MHGEQTNGALPGSTRRSPISDEGGLANPGGCVRQKRVVSAPVAGVKLSVADAIQPDRLGLKPAATVTRRIRRLGERAISRKAIARGMSECFR